MPQVAPTPSLRNRAPRVERRRYIYAVAKPAQQSAFLRSRISPLGGVRSQKLYAHSAQEFFTHLRRVVFTIPDHNATFAFYDFGHHRELVGVGRSHREVRDEPW